MAYFSHGTLMLRVIHCSSLYPTILPWDAWLVYTHSTFIRFVLPPVLFTISSLYVTLPPCHHATIPRLPPCHLATLPPCHCHPATLPPCHPATFSCFFISYKLYELINIAASLLKREGTSIIRVCTRKNCFPFYILRLH